MTDVMPEQTTDTADWDQDAQDGPAVTYPEWPKNPANHRYTISMNGQGPMVVVRGNTAAEVNAAWQELEEAATGAIMGSSWAAIKAAAAIANGLGATPVPQGPNAPANFANPGGHFNAPQTPQGATPPPFGSNVSVPGAPGFQGGAPGLPQPPAPPAQPAVQNAEYRNAGWYRLEVPFKPQGSNPGKPKFDEICAQYQMTKGRPSEGGSYSFNSKGEKAWYVSPQYVSIFPMFSPVPA